MRATRSPYPWRCLWRGFVQMTMVRPCRLITRQRSHIGLTDGLTFIATKRTRTREASRREASWYQDLAPREDPRAVGGDGHRVLEVGGERPVGGGDRPLVLVDVDVRLARGDHRLDRDRHPLLELRPRVRGDEVRHLGVLVHR